MTDIIWDDDHRMCCCYDKIVQAYKLWHSGEKEMEDLVRGKIGTIKIYNFGKRCQGRSKNILEYQ